MCIGQTELCKRSVYAMRCIGCSGGSVGCGVHVCMEWLQRLRLPSIVPWLFHCLTETVKEWISGAPPGRILATRQGQCPAQRWSRNRCTTGRGGTDACGKSKTEGNFKLAVLMATCAVKHLKHCIQCHLSVNLYSFTYWYLYEQSTYKDRHCLLAI